jgi:hypothetical protein
MAAAAGEAGCGCGCGGAGEGAAVAEEEAAEAEAASPPCASTSVSLRGRGERSSAREREKEVSARVRAPREPRDVGQHDDAEEAIAFAQRAALRRQPAEHGRHGHCGGRVRGDDAEPLPSLLVLQALRLRERRRRARSRRGAWRELARLQQQRELIA